MRTTFSSTRSLVLFAGLVCACDGAAIQIPGNRVQIRQPTEPGGTSRVAVRVNLETGPWVRFERSTVFVDGRAVTTLNQARTEGEFDVMGGDHALRIEAAFRRCVLVGCSGALVQWRVAETTLAAPRQCAVAVLT